MEALKNAATAVGDKIHVGTRSARPIIAHPSLDFQEVFSGASAEANKEKAKDPNNTIGERVGGGIDYVKDKTEEAGHAMAKEVHKQKAMH